MSAGLGSQRSIARALALAAALIAIGAVLWVGALLATAQYSEDICFDDLAERPGYGSYVSTAQLIPPTFECRLNGASVSPLVVDHTLLAWARTAAWLIFPVFYLLLMIAILAGATRRTPAKQGTSS